MISRKTTFRFYRKHMLEKMFDKYNKHKKHGPNQDQKSKVEIFVWAELKPIL